MVLDPSTHPSFARRSILAEQLLTDIPPKGTFQAIYSKFARFSKVTRSENGSGYSEFSFANLLKLLSKVFMIAPQIT